MTSAGQCRCACDLYRNGVSGIAKAPVAPQATVEAVITLAAKSRMFCIDECLHLPDTNDGSSSIEEQTAFVRTDA